MESWLKPANILFTSINWRAGIVKQFVREFEKNPEIQGRVVSVDTDRLAAGTYFSHRHYVVPYYREEIYKEVLNTILEKEEVNLIIPNTDRDCNFFKDLREQLTNRKVRVFMPPSSTISLLTDKHKAYKFFSDRGVLTPETYLPDSIPDDLRYPVIIKPRRDSGSQGVCVVSDREQLTAWISAVEDPIVQNFIEGQEYTVDVLADFDCDVIGMVPRRRLAVKAGTSIKSVTCFDERLIAASREICRHTPVQGILCLQLIEETTTKDLYLIEINARIGSGVLASIGAGFNLPRLIHRMNNGEKIVLADDFFQDRVYTLYYHESIHLREDEIHEEGRFL